MTTPKEFNAIATMYTDVMAGTPADDYTHHIDDKEVLHVKFQTGGTATTERNGVFIEDLLSIAHAKLASYNQGLPSRENSLALTKIEEAILWLAARKVERETRGVYGTEQK
jgi:hypothetical protein